MPPATARSIDMQLHVGVIGTPGSQNRFISLNMLESIVFEIFLLCARIPPNAVDDQRL